MKLLELGFLNPNKGASANSSANSSSYLPSFTNNTKPDSFESEKDKDGMKSCKRKIAAYAAIGITAAAAWIYMVIQKKKIEEFKILLETANKIMEDLLKQAAK